MTAGAPTTIELVEYRPTTLPAGRLSEQQGEALHREFGDRVAVEFPSPKTRGQWQLTSLGWVGHIPLGPDLRLALLPRTPLANLFRMWEYAYDLEAHRFFDGLVPSGSIDESFEQLAALLARRVLARVRKGLYREYVPEWDRLPYVRGRLDVPAAACRPWDPRVPCAFEDHTADIDDNRILAWTLDRVLRSGLCGERTLPAVRQACRALEGAVRLAPYGPEACVGRRYHRLNGDYRPLHALARFFLDHAGPAHTLGDHAMVPFIVHMPRLFERFVAAWLAAHLPRSLKLRRQHAVPVGEAGHLRFVADLLLTDAATDWPLAVLDTKYRPMSDGPDAGDLEQVVAYAEAFGCERAALVYPQAVSRPPFRVGRIRVRALGFPLDGDLEGAGRALLRELLAELADPGPSGG